MDKERQQYEREEFLNKCVHLSLYNKHLLIQAATGIGKGKVVATCIAASPSPKKWLVVVPEILQIENYKADLIKHGYEWLLLDKIIDVICYASLSKWEGEEVNLHLNECQKLSFARLDSSFTIRFDQIISDSATVPTDVKERLYDLCPYFLFQMSMDEAIEIGILPKPEIHILKIELDDRIRKHKTKFGKKEYLLTDKARNDRFAQDIKYWTDKAKELMRKQKEVSGIGVMPKWINNKIAQIGTARKQFLASCKTKKAKELIDSLVGKRIIVFTGSVEQSEELGQENSLNSSRGKKHNIETLNKFNNGEIDRLYFNKMGKEGMNFSDIDVVVVVQLDSGKDEGLSTVQSIGRSMRADFPEIWILVCKDTQDEIYLKRALTNFDEKYIVNRE